MVAKTIADAGDLIGGPRAEGRVGDFLLANDHVRVVIGAADDSVVFNPYGGQLLDADVARPAGEPGRDRFGEAFPSVNILTIAATETVEVVADGTDRRRAAVRVVGQGLQFPILPSIPGLTNPVDVLVETVYSLTPESSSVLIETILTSMETADTEVQAYDVLLFGTGLDAFGAPHGAVETGTFDWYGVDGEGIAYALLPVGAPETTLAIPFSDAGQQIVGHGLIDLPAGARRTFKRRLVIAAPDLGAAAVEIARVKGRPTGLLTGSVRDTVGGAVAGAFVTITTPGLDTDGDGADDFIARARSGSDGTFAVALPPGEHIAVVSAANRGQGDPLTFPIRKGKTSQILFVMPSLGTVSFGATDAADGSRIPAKLTLFSGGNVAGRAYGGIGANGTVQVPPGTYTAYVSRGPEWDVNESQVIVGAGLTVTLPAAESSLTRVVGTPGFVAGDFHLHSVQSRDSGVPLDVRVSSLAGEGLEWVAATDHDRATDYAPHIAALGLSTSLVSMVGSEVSLPLYGHFNAYPMPEGAAITRAYDGTRVWFDVTQARRLDGVEILAALRAMPGERVVQMNHPRSSQGYLAAIGYDPAAGTANETVAVGFDAIEVNDEIALEEGQTIVDWFSFLKQGHRMTAVGVSDSHVTWNPGYPRTLVHVGADAPASVTEAQFVAAMKAGKVTVSSGPFVVTSAAIGASTAGLGGTLDATAGGALELRVHVEAPAWAAYSALTVYENGALHSTQALAPPLAGGKYVTDVVVPVNPAGDAFYVVVVTGGGSLFPVSGSGVYAYTNPVYVDRAPAGWTPPGL